MQKLVVAVLCVMSAFYVEQCQSQETVINVKPLGRVQGSIMSTASDREFYAFRGIPYAEPPIGDLRFKDPEPVKPWGDKIIDGTRDGPTCVQYHSFHGPLGTEDCLILNVYTPDLNPNKTLPVMVWIHGGGFIFGSSSFETELYGPGYILDRNVVLVTINYRLGVMGFLSTEDAEAPGNYGLLDQSLALGWVRKHIHHFGGNPESITIFGESAGGASVELQVLSPRSKGYFHKAIAQSGSSFCPWALTTNVGHYTRLLAKDVGCDTSSSKEILDCLRKKDAIELVGQRKNIVMQAGMKLLPTTFVPRVDAEREFPFLPDHPEKLVAEKKFNKVPLIAGVTANEGSLFSAGFATADGLALKEFKEDPLNNILYWLTMEKREDGRKIAAEVLSHYFENKNTDEEIIQQYGEFVSDFGFFRCVHKSVELISKYSDRNTYYYHYAHKGQLSFLSMLNITMKRDWGVSHADELFLMFTSKLFPLLQDPSDLEVSRLIIDMWTSFATDGEPRSERVPSGWLPLKEGDMRYLNIEAKTPTMVHGPMPFLSNLSFWDNLFGPIRPSTKEEL